MEPVRVKLYGLIPQTKPVYLTFQAFGFGFLLVILALTIGRPPPRFGLDETRLPAATLWIPRATRRLCEAERLHSSRATARSTCPCTDSSVAVEKFDIVNFPTLPGRCRPRSSRRF